MSDGPTTITLSGKLIIGLTGNIASGKSAVMRLAAEQGALTIDADKIVHELMDYDAEVQAAVAVAFGPEVRREDGRINRRALGQIVFADPTALKDLEQMTHPLVRAVIAERINASEAAVVFIEAIKLLEGDLVKACHQIWVTRCHRQRQLQRLMICRGLDAESAAARIKAQAPQEEKVAMADVVIDTDGLMTETEAQFTLAWSRLPSPDTLPPTTLVVEDTAVAAKTKPRTSGPKSLKDLLSAAKKPAVEREWPAGLQVRRGKPSDIPSILLLIQKATHGAVTMKRADLLMSFSERSYFIGQVGTDITVVMGWSIDAQVARIDQIFMLSGEDVALTVTAVLLEIEKSANAHIGEMVAAFLPDDETETLPALFQREGYVAVDKEMLPDVWQTAVEESQPPDTILMVKILRDDRLHKS
ncbi:MAG: dephospho-CoA kinase [Chloroflexi bacterium]|nr:dephospho-CoA kinase [Chloroflexota bacterium]MBP7044809.1 dephospho-CoA kinase [Chloroflexota bacterium]